MTNDRLIEISLLKIGICLVFFFLLILQIESGIDAKDKECFHFYSSSHSIQVWAVTFCFVAPVVRCE